jgi:hypothetical protein
LQQYEKKINSLMENSRPGRKERSMILNLPFLATQGSGWFVSGGLSRLGDMSLGDIDPTEVHVDAWLFDFATSKWRNMGATQRDAPPRSQRDIRSRQFALALPIGSAAYGKDGRITIFNSENGGNT